MKIFAVIALLISLCTAAYVDWTLDSIANATQSEGYTIDSPGTCTISQAYTTADNTLKGTFTCTGLKANVTAVHIHDVTSSYSVTTTTGNVLADCPVTVNADGISGSFTCAFKDMVSIDAICNDQCYWNFHTDYDTLGEVRANLVNMRPLCNVVGGVALDGKCVSVGSAPTTGIQVADFYCGFIGTTLKGNGGGYTYVSWDSVAQVLTVSGCTYDLTSDVDYIYLYYKNDDGTSFYTVSTATFPSGRPFSFRSYYFTDWDLARITSGNAYAILESYTNTDGELQFDFNANDYPAFDSSCSPYTDLKYDATAVLKCQYGSEDYSYEYDCSAGYFCSVSSLDVKSCSSLEYCYSCGCGAVDTDLPSIGYACCDLDNCNTLSLATIGCVFGNGAGSIAGGLLVSLFVALFMKWFN
jgi:hypothetical protein